MEDLKKNPIAMAILKAIGYVAFVAALFFVVSLIRNDKSFVETITDPIILVIIGVGTVVTAVQGYMKAKKLRDGEKTE